MPSRIVDWKEASDGKIVFAFMKQCFDKDEIEAYIIGSPQSFIKFGNTFEMRKILVDIVFAWTNQRAGGVSKYHSQNSLLMLLQYQLLFDKTHFEEFFL